MNHTPGPWRVGRKGAIVADVPVHEVSGSDAVDYYGGHLVAESVADRNAPILAAAPEMYDAIRGAMAYLEEMLGPCDAGCACPLHGFHAALAKAEGRA